MKIIIENLLIKRYKTKYKKIKRCNLLSLGRLNITKMLISSKLIYTFNPNYKVVFLKGMEGMDKIILKLMWQNYKKL